MRPIALGLSAVLAGWLLLPSHGLAQEKTAATPRSQAEMDDGMKRWTESITPGEEHRFLDQLVGLWNTSARMWMEGPDSKPTQTPGSATYKWMLKGHYLMQETKGAMMGMPHQGMGILGYDKFRKQYVGIWIDNMSTAIYTMAGGLDPSGKVLVLHGTMDDPMTGEVDKPVIYITRIVSENEHIFEVRDPAYGEENNKVVEIVYTRK